MNTVAVAILVIGLIGVGVGVYGYNKSQSDDQKKKVYSGIGITGSVVLLIGMIMLFMKKSSTSSSNSTNSLPNSPEDIVKMENVHKGIMDTIQAKKQKLVSNLETKLRMRGGANESY